MTYREYKAARYGIKYVENTARVLVFDASKVLNKNNNKQKENYGGNVDNK